MSVNASAYLGCSPVREGAGSVPGRSYGRSPGPGTAFINFPSAYTRAHTRQTPTQAHYTKQRQRQSRERPISSITQTWAVVRGGEGAGGVLASVDVDVVRAPRRAAAPLHRWRLHERSNGGGASTNTNV